jgi:hypothetical protein
MNENRILLNMLRYTIEEMNVSFFEIRGEGGKRG